MKFPVSISRVKLFNLAGLAVGVAGLIFVALKLYSYRSGIETLTIGPGSQAILLLLAVGYGGFGFLPAFAWRMILKGLGHAISLKSAYRIYAISQLAKYVPGNIFQFAGRQALGLSLGLKNKPLAKSTLYELLSLASCGLLFWPLAMPTFIPGFPWGVAAGLFVGSVAAMILTADRIFGRIGVIIISYHLAYLIVGSLVFAVTVSLINDHAQSFATICLIGGAFVLAWLAGLLTPGAPAGLGVREAVLLLLLKDVVPDAVILVSVVTGRCISVVGDLVFFVGGCLVRRHARA